MDKLIEEGEKIAQENPKINNEMLKACRSVSTAGVCICVRACVHVCVFEHRYMYPCIYNLQHLWLSGLCMSQCVSFQQAII